MTKAAYQAVFARGRKFSDPYFLLIVLPSEGGTARVGMAISRRHARTAVERNRIKRLVRETFRQRRAALPPVDVVVMLRSVTAEAPSGDLRARLERLWALLQDRTTD